MRPDLARLCAIIAFLLTVTGNSIAQTVVAVDSLPLDSTQFSKDNKRVNIGYGHHSLGAIGSAIATVEAQDFNQGIIADPALLVQGKVAGVQIYNREGNPNANSLIRVRGLSTIYGAQSPLVVIDGIPGASMDNLEPNDIEQITILKDASAAAIYGIRSGAGVILITTKRAQLDDPSWQINYHGQGGISSVQREISVLDREEFLQAGGVDLGSSTNWVDAITQAGRNQTHHLSLAKTSQRAHMRISANYRDTEGILLNTGFTQFSTRLNAGVQLLQDRLHLQLHGGWTTRDSDFGFQEAFRYALSHNPTAPIFGADAPFAFNAEQFGGYFEQRGLFDAFNPVSMLEQNRSEGKRNIYNIGGQFDFHLNDKWTLTGRLAHQSRTDDERAIYPETSLFRGNAGDPDIRGAAEFRNTGGDFSLLETFANYTHRGDGLNVAITGGYAWQRLTTVEPVQTAFTGLLGSTYDFSSSFTPPPGAVGANEYVQQSRLLPDETLAAFFVRVLLETKWGGFFNLSMRREGASNLGESNRWGNFPAFNTGIDLKRVWPLPKLSQLKIKLGMGWAGNIPADPGLAQATVSTTNNSDGSTTQRLLRARNSDLRWEVGRDFNFGVALATNRLGVDVNFFSRKNRNIIRDVNVDPFIFETDRRYENVVELSTTGWEATLDYAIFQRPNFNWSTTLFLGGNSGTLDENVVPVQFGGSPGGPGFGSANLFRLAEGEALGQIAGLVFTGVDENGFATYEDLNGDGFISLDGPSGDYQVLGNGLPSVEWGWGHQVSFGKWSVNAFFRAATGHSLIHLYRLFYEGSPPAPVSYNIIDTELRIPELRGMGGFSSYAVEKADFLKLDNLTIARRFQLGADRKRSLTAYVTAQNLFVLTNYTGPDPEPALIDYGSVDNGARILDDFGDVFSPGVDRRYGFWPARTILLGVRLSL